MSSISIAGDTSGAITIAAPAVSGTNTVTLPASTGTMAITSDLLGGSSQTWQNLTASRTVSTNYTNSTGRPIFVSVYGGGVQPVGLTIDSLSISNFGTGGSYTGDKCVSAVVPNNSVYSVATTGGITRWNELR